MTLEEELMDYISKGMENYETYPAEAAKLAIEFFAAKGIIDPNKHANMKNRVQLADSIKSDGCFGLIDSPEIFTGREISNKQSEVGNEPYGCPLCFGSSICEHMQPTKHKDS